MKDLSIKLKLLGIVFSSIIIIAIITSIVSVKNLNDVAEADIEKYQKDAYATKTQELKNYTSVVIYKIKHYYDSAKGKTPQEVEKIKQEALSIITKLRYGDNGYYWVQDTSPSILAHPMSPQLIGKDVSGLKDPNGKPFFSEMNEAAKSKGEGMVEYVWAKPGHKDPKPKFSYIQYFKPWDMVVGTGAYVDDIDEQVNSMREASHKKIDEAVMSIVIATIIAIVIIGFLVNLMAKIIIVNPINNLQVGMIGFFKYLNKQSNDCDKLKLESKDELGTMGALINENIEQTKKLIRDDEALIEEVKGVVQDIEKGYLTSRVNARTANDSLEELKENLNNMLNVLERTIAKDINVVKEILDQYSRLNFLKNIDDTSELAVKINGLSKIINEMLKASMDDGYSLEESAKFLSANVDKLSTSSNEQAASLEETAAALEEITSTMRNNNSNMVQMSKHADELSDSVGEGQELANQTTVAMDNINDEVTSISEAITVIDQIAFQTNILSLNAAVEAATAGEAGKGFAVVAQEVRNLAARSAEAAKEIKDLVENATTKANSGKEIAYKMINGYEGINSNISNTLKIISDVSVASKEQMQGIEQINDALTQLDQATQQNAMVANETNDIAQSVNDMAQRSVASVNEKEFIGKK